MNFLAALLKLVPVSWFVWGAFALSLAGGFWWYTDHVEGIQHAKDAAADKRLADAQIVHSEEVEARAKVLTNEALSTFKAALAAPPAVDAPHVLVCPRTPAPRAVPANGGARPAAHAEAGVPAAGPADNEPAERDVGPPLDKLYEDADAWIVALQNYITDCIAAGICKAPPSASASH
jgi:hypothetical protein